MSEWRQGQEGLPAFPHSSPTSHCSLPSPRMALRGSRVSREEGVHSR